ncbi:Rap1a/Tai family immunity protein [Marinibaculum pumilum]|uniref:Rap1a/Tai family immunity protein n=1 Tax=Marinibaculum pumilum TaxID=1766165 RepID=A0ABV7L9Y2_9PROT
MILILAMASAISSGPVHAAQSSAGSGLSTATLARECDPALRAEQPLDAFPFCSGYLLGIIDGIVIARRDGAAPHFCPPEDGLTTAQLLPLFLGWTKDHPGMATQPARRSMRQALLAAYPCRAE